MSTQTNDELPPNPLEKVVNGITFILNTETKCIYHHVKLQSPDKRREIDQQAIWGILDNLDRLKLSVQDKKIGLTIDVMEYKPTPFDEPLIRIEYRYTGSLASTDGIDWEELTDWLLTHALHQFKHQ